MLKYILTPVHELLMAFMSNFRFCTSRIPAQPRLQTEGPGIDAVTSYYRVRSLNLLRVTEPWYLCGFNICNTFGIRFTTNTDKYFSQLILYLSTLFSTCSTFKSICMVTFLTLFPLLYHQQILGTM